MSVTTGAALWGVGLAAFVALAVALAEFASAWIFRARMLIPTEVPEVPVTLILPATGKLPGLADLFADLRAQTLRPARLIIAVESRDDPAYSRAVGLLPQFPDLRTELVVAGLCDRRGQKCTNILAALPHLGDADPYIVLFDADIRPQPWWLAGLIAPLVGGRADIVSAYRWQVPRSLSLATLTGAAIDRAIAVIYRLWDFRSLWGGSIALTRPTLAALDLPRILDRAACEDVMIGAAAAALGLRVLTRRGLRLPTPLGGTIGALWRFFRRQYQLVFIYRPGLWSVYFIWSAADLAARSGLVIAALLGAGVTAEAAIAALVGLGLLGSAAVQLRIAVGRLLKVPDRALFMLAQHVLMWSALPVGMFNVAALLAGVAYSPVRWAHVRYRVDRRGRVVSATRFPYPTSGG